MITRDELRSLLKNPSLSDEEADTLNAEFSTYAELVIEAWLYDIGYLTDPAREKHGSEISNEDVNTKQTQL